MLKLVIKLTSFICFLISLTWAYFEPLKYDPWVATSAALAVFLGSFIQEKVKDRFSQNQSVKNKSTGIQAGKNVTINFNSNKDIS